MELAIERKWCSITALFTSIKETRFGSVHHSCYSFKIKRLQSLCTALIDSLVLGASVQGMNIETIFLLLSQSCLVPAILTLEITTELNNDSMNPGCHCERRRLMQQARSSQQLHSSGYALAMHACLFVMQRSSGWTCLGLRPSARKAVLLECRGQFGLLCVAFDAARPRGISSCKR